MRGMAKNSVVAGDYKGRGIVCGAKGPFINLKGSKTIFLNKQNIKRYEPVTKESTKDESSSLSLEILGAELLSSICALSESSQKADEFLVAVEFIDESKCVINIDSRTYHCFVNAMLEEIPSKSGSAPQKKSHTLTIALIIAGVAIVLGLSSMIAAGNSLSSTDSDVKQVFDAKRFLVEEDGVARPKTMEEVVADLGEPQKSEDWNYQFGASEYPVKSLSYHDGNYVYDFYEGTLARIQIFIPATFSSKDTIPQMYNLDSGHVVADTPAAYRIENCGVHDLWCTYGDEENTIDIAYISYTNFFDNPYDPVMVGDGESPPSLQLLDSTTTSDGYIRYVTGHVANNSDKTYSYVQVSISLYKDDVLVGSTLDNANFLEPGGIWEFNAMILDDSANKFKIEDITGW